MNKSEPLRPDRIRRIPKQFSWLDQRLVREHYMKRCCAEAWMLYLFLLTVSDAQGLSFYSERTLCQSLNWQQDRLSKARKELVSADLIAFRHPYYQVLSLDRPAENRPVVNRPPGNRPAVPRTVPQPTAQQQRATNSPTNSPPNNDNHFQSLAQILQSFIERGQNHD